jgi:hypothetical protein
MSALSDLLQYYVGGPAMAGGPGSRGSEFDRRSLQRQLERLRHSREIAFWICVALLVVLFVGAVAAAVAYRNDPQTLSGLSAATGGLTLMGLVGSMVWLWSAKVKADLLIALVSSMSEDALRAVLTSLVGKV